MLRALYAVWLVAMPVSVRAQASPNPWFGKWQLKLQDSGEKPETLIYSPAGNGAVRMMSVEEGSVIITRFDGRPSADIGKHGHREPRLACKATSPTSYTRTFFQTGKPYVQGVNTLAADGKTFTEVSWLVTRPDKRAVLIYDRQ